MRGQNKAESARATTRQGCQDEASRTGAYRAAMDRVMTEIEELRGTARARLARAEERVAS